MNPICIGPSFCSALFYLDQPPVGPGLLHVVFLCVLFALNLSTALALLLVVFFLLWGSSTSHGMACGYLR